MNWNNLKRNSAMCNLLSAGIKMKNKSKKWKNEKKIKRKGRKKRTFSGYIFAAIFVFNQVNSDLLTL